VEERHCGERACGSVPGMDTRSPAPARAVLRSGLRVVRRDDTHLQIGLDEPDRLVLPDLPGLLEALTAPGRRTPSAEVAAVLDRLAADGWLVDPADRARRARARAAERPPVALEVDPLLRVAVERASSAAALRVDDAAPTRLVVTLGEPRRRTSDRLVAGDLTHLWLAVAPSWVRVGPFVEPGRTACLRCVDAHLGERDARRATVLHQLDDLPPAPYPRWDPCLLELGVAWALRDVVRRLDGDLPSLRSATVTVTEDLRVTRRDWLRHPHCGCAWG
jgi:hypothetical protein